MRTLLLSPPYLADYMRNARCDFVSLSASQWYPIWLGYAGSWLEHCGHEVKLVDAPSMHLDHAATERLITDWRPDLLVVYAGQKSRTNDIEFGDRLTEKLGCKSVLVGPYFSTDPLGFMREARAIPYGIESEMDHPLAELASGKPPQEIKNLLYRDGPKIVRNELRPYLTGEQLDQIPFVSRFFKSHLNLYDYKTISEFYPFVDIMSGRGCKWGQCTFCLWVHTFVKGHTYNLRSVENVLDEFATIEKELPEVRSIMIQDDMLTDSRAAELSKGIEKRGICIPWSCYARSNLSYETMVLMKKAHCRVLHVGYESGDPEILDNIKKGVSIEVMTEFTHNAHRAGLRIHGDFAIGYLGETAESVQKTIRWAKELNPHTAQFQLANPLVGTPFHAALKEKGWLSENGDPNYPHMSADEIRSHAKAAYRAFYLSPQYFAKCVRHPYEHFFGRLKSISVAVPAMFWKRW